MCARMRPRTGAQSGCSTDADTNHAAPSPIEPLLSVEPLALLALPPLRIVCEAMQKSRGVTGHGAV